MKSTQIHIVPFGFGTTSIPSHQSVEMWTLAITPSCSIFSSSSCTFPMRGMATHLGPEIECGFVSFFNLISLSPLSFSRPWNIHGNSWTGVVLSRMAPTRTASSSALIAGNPSRLWQRLLTTNISCCTSHSPCFGIPVKHPVTGNGWLLRPLSLWSGRERRGLPISLCLDPEKTDTSAPVSMSNSTGTLFKLTESLQGLFVMLFE